MNNLEKKIAERLRALAEGFEGYNLNYVFQELESIEDMVLELSGIEEEDNDPLTWDELKQMERKPVWVEYGINFNQKRWVVINSFHNAGSFCYMNVSGNYPNTFWQKDMGENEFWQAYRKERN